VHLLVNNAGVGNRAMFSNATFNDYDWGMNVNVTGVFNGIQTFVPRMKQYCARAELP
jgi:NAD(P)-dependent dehydrogenase (short-subunit alcohol dehydrogenase family)